MRMWLYTKRPNAKVSVPNETEDIRNIPCGFIGSCLFFRLVYQVLGSPSNTEIRYAADERRSQTD